MFLLVFFGACATKSLLAPLDVSHPSFSPPRTTDPWRNETRPVGNSTERSLRGADGEEEEGKSVVLFVDPSRQPTDIFGCGKLALPVWGVTESLIGWRCVYVL